MASIVFSEASYFHRISSAMEIFLDEELTRRNASPATAIGLYDFTTQLGGQLWAELSASERSTYEAKWAELNRATPHPDRKRAPTGPAASLKRDQFAIKRQRGPESNDVIDLVSSDEDEPPPGRVEGGASRFNFDPPQASPQVVMEPQVERQAAPAAPGGELTLTGSVGLFALRDFPHARENCAIVPWKPGHEQQHCANCYCYVCDRLASSCDSWVSHCCASHTSAQWRRARAAARAPAAPAPPANSTATSLGGFESSERPLSLAELMDQVRQVWPVEVQRPAGFIQSVELRPYQKQSLAFMLEIEKAPSDDERVGYVTFEHPTKGKMASHTERVWRPHFLGSGPLPDAGKTHTIWNWKAQEEKVAVRGGWLCDEVGMGKTAVAIALILANPSTRSAVNDASWKLFTGPTGPCCNKKAKKYSFREEDEHRQTWGHRWQSGSRMPSDLQVIELKATLVLTKVSLLGQWRDEINKFAPGLKVVTYHGSAARERKQMFQPNSRLLRDADVVIGTVMTGFPDSAGEFLRFHRLILDESHIPDQGGGFDRNAHFKWGLTGTPCASSLTDLVGIAVAIGHWDKGLGLRPAYGSFVCASDVATFKKLMIRHTKDQHIGGEAALSLPTLQSRTVWLTMDGATRARYTEARRDVGNRAGLRNAIENGPSVFTVTRCLAPIIDVCCQSKLKTNALCDDLQELLQHEPNPHAVVFTASKVNHAALVAAVQHRHPQFEIFQFTGSTAPTARHNAIRKFQTRDLNPKLFIITLRAGNCGITLTAATRVYLMEPCLLPAHEIQAAGRIHRLGQSEEVLVTRFCFKSSYEEKVVRLHKRIDAGEVEISERRVAGSVVKFLVD